MGDTVTRQAEANALAVGTLKLILLPARGIHRWGDERGAMSQALTTNPSPQEHLASHGPKAVGE